MHDRDLQRKKIALAAFAIISLFLFSNFSGFMSQPGASSQSPVLDNSGAMADVAFLGGVSTSQVNYTGDMNVLIMFNFSNQNALNGLLVNLSNPLSPQYDKFLTESQFNSEFSPKLSVYNSAINYFRQFGISVKETFQNRVVLSLEGSAENFSTAFNATITVSGSGSSLAFDPSSQPELPQWLAGSVSNVIGLSSVKPQLSMNLFNEGTYVNSQPKVNSSAGTQFQYPPMPSTLNGIQVLYGSYFQPAYNETALLQSVMPTQAVIASILWGGSYQSNGNTVYTGPYNPSDVYYYFNNTLPSNQPTPHVYGVPVNGALPPGSSARNDTSGASVENTLDLEMLGSTAPGSYIYNVYGQNGTFTDLTAAFNEVLSPGSSYPMLNNVSVISNSWGSNDTLSTTWNQFLQECQARGITVLASAGDSGNDLKSPKSVSPTEVTQFPSSLAYDTYGVVAVGGTNISISPVTYAIQNQQVWYNPQPPSSGGVMGSVGGISSYYAEPSWQRNSQANQVIKDQGRGLPDVAAVANNTLIYYSNATGGGNLYIVAGTSISSPVLGGIIAEMDQYRVHEGQSWLGFISPSIYQLGTEQYDPSMAGGYTPALTPFYDITQGHNANFSALPGYDLVTGMGSINAYNFLYDVSGTKYNVSFVETGLSSGTTWSVEVNGVSHSSNQSQVNFSLINGSYQFRVAPVGNDVANPVAGNFSIHGSTLVIDLQFLRGFTVNFQQGSLPQGTSWVILAWNYTESSMNSSLPLLFPNGTYNFTAISSDPNYYGSTGNFTVNGSAIDVAVHFRRGIFNVTFVEQGLPASQEWSVSNDTLTLSSVNGSLTFTLLGGQYTFNIHPTGPYVANRTLISLNTDGMNRTVYLNFGYGYNITFKETGVPQGATWNVMIGDYNVSAANSTISVEVQNGSYSYYAYYQYSGTTRDVSGNVNVTGSSITVPINFTASRTASQYYLLYMTLFILGLAMLVIGVLMLRKR